MNGYDAKLDRARQIITEHFAALDPQVHAGSPQTTTEPSHAQLRTDEFFDKLRAAGGTNETALAECSWSDLEKCGIPTLIAKQVANVFRSNSAKPDEPLVTSRMVERMTLEQVIARYNPREDNAIHERLRKEGKGKRFVAFLDTGETDVAGTMALLQEIKQGFGERQLYNARRIYAVGESPDNLVDVNPIYPSRALRPDGTCDQTNRSWAGVPLEVRQLVHLIVPTINLSLEKAHDLLDLALDPNAVARLSQRYAVAAVGFDERKRLGTLPSLKMLLAGGGEGGKDHPFAGPNMRY